MRWFLAGMPVGVFLWAMLAPDRWQFVVQDLAEDAYQLVCAWAREGWRKLRERV